MMNTFVSISFPIAALPPVLDSVVIALYLGITIAIGILAKGQQENTGDYFSAGGTMSGRWASLLIGLSIAATLFSGISFIAVPSVAYREGIGILYGLLSLPLCWVILRFWFLPRYFAFGSEEPYHFIEERLGTGVRTQAAVLYVLMRFSWMATLIYAPSIALLALLGMDDSALPWLIVLIGLSSTVYTVFGGLRGVIVTDAIQFFIIAGGILYCLLLVVWRVPVSFPEAFAHLQSEGLFRWPNASLNFSDFYTWWNIVLGFGVTYLATYLADQMSLQRYLASGSVRAASRAFGYSIAGAFGVVLLLILVGLALNVWYHFVPDPGLSEHADRIFPYFVVTQLPAGLSGLVIAAILAATMSSVTSGINALASSLVYDLLPRLRRQVPGQSGASVRTARWYSLAIGILSTGLAMTVGNLGTLYEAIQAILGIFLGPILAAVLLALLRIRVSGFAFTCGVLMSLPVGWWVISSGIATTWMSVATCLTCVVTSVVTYTLVCKVKRS